MIKSFVFVPSFYAILSYFPFYLSYLFPVLYFLSYFPFLFYFILLHLNLLFLFFLFSNFRRGAFEASRKQYDQHLRPNTLASGRCCSREGVIVRGTPLHVSSPHPCLPELTPTFTPHSQGFPMVPHGSPGLAMTPRGSPGFAVTRRGSASSASLRDPSQCFARLPHALPPFGTPS